MNTISTDDAARRQEFIWFGPAEFPLLTGARLPAVGAAVLLTPTFVFLAWVLTPFLDALPGSAPAVFLIHAGAALVIGSASSILLIRAVGKRVSPVTPFRHHVAVLRSEINTPRPDTERVEYRITAGPELWLENRPEHRSLHRITAPTFIRLDSDEPQQTQD